MKNLLMTIPLLALALTGCAGLNQFQSELQKVDLEPVALTGKVLLAEYADQFTPDEYALVLDAIDAALAYQQGAEPVETVRVLLPQAVEVVAARVTQGKPLPTDQKLAAIAAVTALQYVVRDEPELVTVLRDLANAIAAVPAGKT